jgi:hypothetical protein
MTEQMTEERWTGLPDGAAAALAAVLAPRLRARRPDGSGVDDKTLWAEASNSELLDALWDAGLLAVPGAPPRPRLWREPADLSTREGLADRVAAVLEPRLREARAGEADTGGYTPSAHALLASATLEELVDVLWRAGMLTLDGADDRAQLRESWSALATAMDVIARGEVLTADVLARVPAGHVTYLLGHRQLRRQLQEAWSRTEAAKSLLAVIRDVASVSGDPDYLRTNLAVLQGLLDGTVSWELTRPRDGAAPMSGSLYDEVRYRAARSAVDSEGLFAAVGAIMARPDAVNDPFVTTQHLFAHRSAVYAWATAGLLRFIAERYGDADGEAAAALVHQGGQPGGDTYVDDLPRSAAAAGRYRAWLAGTDMLDDDDYRNDDDPVPPPGQILCRFLGGSKHGDLVAQPIGLAPQHCMPWPTSGRPGALTWASAGSWPGRRRYIPEGFDDHGRLLMVWRHLTTAEYGDAQARQADAEYDDLPDPDGQEAAADQVAADDMEVAAENAGRDDNEAGR